MISVIIVLLVVGVLLWCASLLPIDPVIMQIIRAVVVVVALVLWLLQVFGVWHGMPRWIR